MRVIAAKTVRLMARRHPLGAHALLRWLELAQQAQWQNLTHVRSVFPHADEVKTASGRSAVVFNIAGNKYRLITAIHYNRQQLFVMLLLTHADYSKERWKADL
ncbi:MAG TPA: type II toxin-antitoxin system HigB family toxin [Phycisphaerae bacterium]|nr:type II toxin-antitoxin system HigB family toxin [Phycisphaerae bacterium]